ncbi:Poly [ADP-ribose] polymerase 1 [Orchesella cincta]|uniref:Poly [ADP-ribose] polymerase n=1 Tax=Orchesella cincta TaxID=48709 RepID=A0A1D2N4D4_ORCCI|nr:Poly [ADP-ribose] polymerase 1 [Orchesella cincta]
MLDNLMEIEIAYELLAQGDKGESGSIDSYYNTLNAEIDILEAHSEEFKIIKKYLMNTHVFKVIRKGENKRYRPFKDLHNRRLLWHGSRITNFAGIVSQGLRIAGGPVSGYMFGKGIYFADMVSKSANYCNTSRDNPTGLLLLCEVALGDMHELKQAKDTISKPPKPNHSVKGLGQTEPDPKETHTFSDGVMVPYGKPVTSKAAQNSALLYNEYIVYDIAQVNIKYLLRVNFKYGGRR